jgi:HYR domain
MVALAAVAAFFASTVAAVPPTFTSLPASMTVPATGAAGAVVDYPPATAVDPEDGPLPATCLPASGTLFAIGETTVTCTVTDSEPTPNTVTGSFTVTVTPLPPDTTPPVVTVPGPLTQQATGPGGAVVTFVASATDAVDGPRPVTCAPTSGSTFPVGSTTVTCSASDLAAPPNTGSATFVVTVTDTTAPTFSGVPAGLTLQAAGPSGAVGSYALPTATDLVDGARPVACSPASGSTFPFGSTPVNCSASDTRGNTATATFSVTVQDPAAPVVTVPASREVEANGPNGSIVNYPPATAIDRAPDSRSARRPLPAAPRTRMGRRAQQPLRSPYGIRRGLCSGYPVRSSSSRPSPCQPPPRPCSRGSGA